jgi:putative glutamine amidotransferase
MLSRPKIGLTMRLEIETNRFYLGRHYSEALAVAGAVPVHLPLIPDADMIAEALAGLDGLLLPGSDSDVDPSYFGEEPHPNLKKVVPEKDSTEFLVLKEAERNALPILAICYGMQALNVSRGGTLIQDIASQVDNCIKHEQGIPLERNSHGIVIESASIMGLVSDGAQAKVNSHHHQAISKVGEHLRVSARAGDGIVECVEDTREDRFVLGVQWHPELNWRTDRLSMAIFEHFVEKCSAMSLVSPRWQVETKPNFVNI